MGVTVEKIPGGLLIDGLELKGGKCGCTSILACCHSWSKVRRSGDVITYTGKASTPDSRDLFSWSYKVRKDGVTVEVSMDDARDKTIFSGFYPPALTEWQERGWDVVESTGDREDLGMWRCAACKWLYKEADHETAFVDLPSDWRCPVCKASKDVFERIA